MSKKYKGMVTVIEQFSKRIEAYNNPNTIQNMVNSLLTYEDIVKKFDIQINYEQILKNINNINNQIMESLLILIKDEQYKNQTNMSLSSLAQNISNLDKDLDVNEYTEEIVDELCNNVDPNTIAENLETKTKIPAKTWIEFIIAIILLITAFLSSSPIEINFNEYNIKNVNYDSKSSQEMIIENLEQINENTTNHQKHDKWI